MFMNDQSQLQNQTPSEQILAIQLDQFLLYLNQNDCMHPCFSCGKSNWNIPLIDSMPAIYMAQSVRNTSVSAWSYHMNCKDCGGVQMISATHVWEYFHGEREQEKATVKKLAQDHAERSIELLPLETRIAKLETHVVSIQDDIDSLETDIQTFRTESSEDFSSVRNEFSTVRAEMQQGFVATRSDLKKESSIRFLALIVLTGGLASLMIKGFGWI